MRPSDAKCTFMQYPTAQPNGNQWLCSAVAGQDCKSDEWLIRGGEENQASKSASLVNVTRNVASFPPHPRAVPTTSAMTRMLGTDSLLGQWVFEIASVATASGVVAAMVIVLINFDREPVFDGPVLTLNAIISTLSTTNRVCLLAMLASAISQWNWLLFSSEPRRLVDFEYVAAASRGPLGSLKVLLNYNILGGGVLRAGALVTILTIALDPFAQQLVQLKEEAKRVKSHNGTQASVSKADRYSLGTNTIPAIDMHISVEPDIGMEIATMLFYSDATSGVRQQVAYYYSSNNCEFEPFDSLAVCSQCKDITSSLKRRVRRNQTQAEELIELESDGPRMWNNTEYYLPNGLRLNNADGDLKDPKLYALSRRRVYMTMFGTGYPNRTVAMGHIDALIWAQSVIKVDDKLEDWWRVDWPGPKVSAQECALYYCVRRYTTAIRKRTLQEKSVILESHKRLPGSWDPHFEGTGYETDFNFSRSATDDLVFEPSAASFPHADLNLGEPRSLKEKNVAEGDEKPVYAISEEAVYGLSVLMKRKFTTCIKGRHNCSLDKDDADWGPPNGYLLGHKSAIREPPIAERLWETSDLNGLFEKLALGITTAIRNGADDNRKANGTALFPVTVYSVVWPWIGLHCVATLGALVFLVVTIWSTSKLKQPVWKSSELAVFLQATAANGVFSGHETCIELEEKARGVSIVLPGQGGRGAHDVKEEEEEEEEEDGIMLTRSSPSYTESLVSRRTSREDYWGVR
ncbi:hypothetical protein FDECE_3770 [Fusarium decemcellulare]|nr:hypothetical protein FDECE_3770 [Fusarium decemcellulare]